MPTGMSLYIHRSVLSARLYKSDAIRTICLIVCTDIVRGRLRDHTCQCSPFDQSQRVCDDQKLSTPRTARFVQLPHIPLRGIKLHDPQMSVHLGWDCPGDNVSMRRGLSNELLTPNAPTQALNTAS